MELKVLEDNVKQHLKCFNVVNNSATEKKIDSILDSIFGAIVRSDTTYYEFNEFLEDIKNERVFNHEFLFKGGNIYDYINCRWEKICKSLFRQRPVGLGTPNAASGEGELLLNFISKYLAKPTKGDLVYKYTKNGIESKILFEIKGSGFRVTGNTTGIEFNNKALEVANNHRFTPNKSLVKSKELDAVELEKSSQISHWNLEFKKHCRNDIYKFIEDWLKIINQEFDIENENLKSEILSNQNELQTDFLKKIIVKQLFLMYLKKENFSNIIYLGNNGENCKIIPNDYNQFEEMIEKDEIKIGGDYFRINQSTSIGFYIDFK